MDIVNTLEHFGQLILNRFGIEISLVYWWWVIQGSHNPSLFLLQQPTDVVRFVLVQTTPESVLTQHSGGVVDVEWYIQLVLVHFLRWMGIVFYLI